MTKSKPVERRLADRDGLAALSVHLREEYFQGGNLVDSPDMQRSTSDITVAQSPWFAIRTRSRHEQVVQQQLERKPVEAFLPTVARWSRWKDRRKKVIWPLFPGYCFARFSSEHRLGVLRCSGVIGIVSFDGAPAPIAPHEIDDIRRLVDTDFLYDPCPLIREGMMVELVHGPLKGVVGRLIRKGTRARLVLAVNLIGRAVAVEVDASDVKAY